MHRLGFLVAFSLLSVMSCNGRREEVNNAKSPDANPPETPRASIIEIPALQEVLFINVDTVLVFPGHLAGLVDEQLVNRERVPLITHDGGESWHKLSPEPISFTSIHFANVSQGWLVNRNSELLRTSDGGVTWSMVSKVRDGKNTLSLSQQISFTDELNGWIQGGSSLWRTNDGGETWSLQAFPWFLRKCFFRGAAAWVGSDAQSGQNSLIYTTEDGGKNWREIELPNTATSDLFDGFETEDLFFIDDKRGWLANNARGVFRTDDSGETWQRQRLPGRRMWIRSLSFTNESEGWAAGWKPLARRKGEYHAILLHTTNGGDTWQQVHIGVEESSLDILHDSDAIARVYFGDAQNGWLVVADDEGEEWPPPRADLYRTRDGGLNWKKVLSVKSPFGE